MALLNGIKSSALIFTLVFAAGCSSPSPEVPADNMDQEENIQENGSENLPVENGVEAPQNLGAVLLETIKEYYALSLKVKEDGSEESKDKLLFATPKIEALLEKGANVNYKDRVGNTPLSVAVKNRDESMVAKLLTKGANPDTKMADGYLVMPYALDNKDAESGLTLIKHKANPSGEKGYMAPLEIAQERSLSDSRYITVATELLSSGANPDTTNKNGEPVLLSSIKRKNSEFSKALIDGGASLNYVDSNGISILNWAILQKENETARLMIEKDASILDNNKTVSPTAWASLTGNETIYEYLKTKGITVKDDEKGWAALQLEKTLSSKELTDLLLGKKMKVEEVPLPVASILPKKKKEAAISLPAMKFLSIDYNDEHIKIFTEDKIRSRMTLDNPTRVVFDFVRFTGVKNFTRTYKDKKLQKVAVGRHEGWYRVVFYLAKGTGYKIETEEDGIKLIYQ